MEVGPKSPSLKLQMHLTLEKNIKIQLKLL